MGVSRAAKVQGQATRMQFRPLWKGAATREGSRGRSYSAPSCGRGHIVPHVRSLHTCPLVTYALFICTVTCQSHILKHVMVSQPHRKLSVSCGRKGRVTGSEVPACDLLQ